MFAHLTAPAVSPQLSTPSTDTAASPVPGRAYRLSDKSSLGTAITRTSSTVASQRDDAESVNADFQREVYGPAEGEKGWDQYEVCFAPNDPEDPHNWSRLKRWYITILGGMLVLNATFASSTPSGIVPQMMEEFGFGREVATLTIALFVAGYCVGPLIWGPLSENIGRKWPIFISFVVYTGFQVGCALSRNTASILVFRFLSGCFAASPLVISGALISDIWDANTRGKALGFFTLAPFAGPALGPTVSGFMAVSGVSWRWTYWVLTLFAGTCTLFVLFTLPETYTPLLLVKRAQKLRKETGDDRWWAPMEKKKVALGKKIEEVVARPFKIFFREPMLIVITIFMSFVYGCIYLLFEAYPIVFTIGHHFNAGISGLMFMPLFVGCSFGVLGYLLIWNPKYERLARELAPEPVPPEVRLEQAMWAGPMFAASFFWFGWSSYPSVSFWSPMLSGGLLGFSVVWIFLALFNYIIDAYLFVAASALASNTVIRSAFGAGFPLFATQMYETLNPRWASTLLGLIALIMVPIPFALVKYGPHLRHKSKYAPSKPAPPPPAKTAEDAV